MSRFFISDGYFTESRIGLTAGPENGGPETPPLVPSAFTKVLVFLTRRLARGANAATVGVIRRNRALDRRIISLLAEYATKAFYY
jgi:hypothetical protein